MSDFYVGQTVRIDMQFRKSGVLIDPDDVTVRVLRPDDAGEVAPPPSVVRDSSGNYHAAFVVDAPGVWRWRVDGLGTAFGIAEGQISVPYSPFE